MDETSPTENCHINMLGQTINHAKLKCDNIIQKNIPRDQTRKKNVSINISGIIFHIEEDATVRPNFPLN